MDPGTLSLLIGGVLSLLGVGSALWTARQGRTSTENLAEKNQNHQLDMAREARNQDRQKDAYVGALVLALSVGDYVQAILPAVEMLEIDPKSGDRTRRALPTLPSSQMQTETTAKIDAFASDAVLAAWGAWFESALQILSKAARIEHAIDFQARNRMPSRQVDPDSEWEELETTLRPSETMLRGRLVDVIASELGSRRVDPATLTVPIAQLLAELADRQLTKEPDAVENEDDMGITDPPAAQSSISMVPDTAPSDPPAVKQGESS